MFYQEVAWLTLICFMFFLLFVQKKEPKKNTPAMISYSCMAKAKKNTDKKAPTQAPNTFHDIMKASVKDNPKPNKKKDK
jgi:hypothetical protein